MQERSRWWWSFRSSRFDVHWYRAARITMWDLHSKVGFWLHIGRLESEAIIRMLLIVSRILRVWCFDIDALNVLL